MFFFLNLFIFLLRLFLPNSLAHVIKSNSHSFLSVGSEGVVLQVDIVCKIELCACVYCCSDNKSNVINVSVKNIKLTLNEKSRNYKTVIECGKRVQNILIGLKKDLFGCFR